MSNNYEIVAVLRQALEALGQSQQILDEYMAECVTARQDNINAITSLRHALNSVEAIASAESTLEAEKCKAGVAHDLYTDDDKDRPAVICDRNGSVALGLCKRCGKGECELSEPCVAEVKKQEPFGFLTNKRQRFNFEPNAIGLSNMPMTIDWKIPLYGAPQPQRTWVGLTGEEIYDLWQCNVTLFQFQEIAQIVEAKLKAKNFAEEKNT